MCEVIEKVTNGRFEYCERKTTEEREVYLDLPKDKYAEIPVTKKFCSFHAAMFDIHKETP